MMSPNLQRLMELQVALEQKEAEESLGRRILVQEGVPGAETFYNPTLGPIRSEIALLRGKLGIEKQME